MVVESLTNPVSAEKRPYQMMLLGFLYSSVAIFFSLWIFYEYSSLIMVFLTVFACVPIVYNTIKLEESKDEGKCTERALLREHCKALWAFMFLFLGITAGAVLWYVFLPNIGVIVSKIPIISDMFSFLSQPDAREVLFSTQMETFQSIQSGNVGMVAKMGNLKTILLNNLNVLMFCIVFSFVYGLGAIFILTWNATVIGVAIGKFITEGLARLTEASLVAKTAGYMQVFSIGFLKYLPHGVLEILAYFVGGLSGGIISVAVIKHRLGTNKFEKILLDSSDLLLIAVGLLIVAAFVEVYVTPVIF